MFSLLTVAVVGPAVFVVAAIFAVLWQERSSPRTSSVAIVSGTVLAAWLAITTALAIRGFFLPTGTQGAPAVGVVVAGVLVALAVSLSASSPLRRLLTNQQHLIRLNVWRLEGLVFLILMWKGQVPALWALPAGIGDVIVGAIAPWIASQLEAPGGSRRAIIFNVFGMVDLIVAVGLGIMTNPGPGQVFLTTPTSALITHFPLVLVPTFLVPLAFVLHVVSLWQLLGGTWASPRAAAPAATRYGALDDYGGARRT
jgi:hypothetical protein